MKQSQLSLSYSQCQASDLDALVQISQDTFRAAFEKDNDPKDFEAYMSSAFNKVRLSEELGNADSLFYFVLEDNHLVGYFKLNLGEAQTDVKDPNAMELERIYVQSSHQGKGIGAAMLHKVVALARNRALDYLWLGVWERNPGAIRFYERYGFQKFGTHPYYIGKDKQTDWLLRLDL
ncbi:GNAT family N-acetyltransferase [Flagellimonas flava]|uniref:Ribosomal protein S18 acetylase RimI n=1 Tax=Flagellimonas flava TaxID=570519 RepID=A0A1M5Q242_9FLAO|nr:GNAT family N-acetyltransferase [Allomuricauda flava]SHH07841.1 Ribosomal protein S18 acetylase RimI [Allomuricauda flava]